MAVTLDSGAGCSVWPRGWYAGNGWKLLPKAADIPCYGQRVVKFRGVDVSDLTRPT